MQPKADDSRNSSTLAFQGEKQVWHRDSHWRGKKIEFGIRILIRGTPPKNEFGIGILIRS